MPAFEPLFVQGPAGRLFVVHHRVSTKPSHCLLVVPAFAEEMNKSRRQIALLARALQARGTATLIVDPRGTGDSDGRLEHSTVAGWCDDLAAAQAYANDIGYDSVSLLALRSGALLSVAFLERPNPGVHRLVWWQPVATGKLMMNQFLRLKMAADMMGGGRGDSVQSLRARLAEGEPVEVAGYTLSPELVAGFDALDLATLRATVPVDWINIGSPDSSPSPVSQRVVKALQHTGVPVRWHAAAGDPFWSTVEIATAAAPIEATVRVLGTAP